MENNIEELLRNVNQFNTPLDSKYYADLNRDVVDDIHASIDEIIFIRRLVSNDIKRVCDIEKDEEGKIIIDVTDPHILEDMTFFTEAGDHFRKHGCYTLLTPNKHPKSAYYQLWKEEKRRIREGLVREDGEWIPGDYYWYLNYCPIMLTKRVNKGGKRADRLHDFANVWLGDYLFFHYKNQAEYIGQHIEVLKCRGIGASFKMGSIGPRNALFKPRSKTFYVASNMQYLNKDGVLTKSWDYLDFNALNTPFPRLRLKDTQLEKRIGYKDVRSGAEKGMKSDIIGLSLNDDPDKARGKRGDIIFEEYGSFPHIKKAWNVSRDAVEDGENVFAQMCAMGTGGTEGSDFEGAEDMFYHPTSYNIMPLVNVFDRNTEGKGEAGFFWGAYLNRANCYDINGMPDVTKALKEIYLDYEKIRKSSSDTRALTQRRAEKPITPQDSMMKIDGTMFPVGEIRDYLETVLPMIDEFVGPHYIGDLAFDSNGKVAWKVGGYKKPIREFPLQDNKAHPYYEKIYTPDGIKNWGDVSVGDNIYNSYGGVSKIIDIPFDDYADIYEMTLKDGRVVRSSGGHLWDIVDTNGYNKLLTTEFMYKNWYRIGKEYKNEKYRNLKYFIPQNNGVDFGYIDVKIPPYFLGLMIGDGCFTKSHKCINRAYFTSLIYDMDIYKKYIPYKYKTTDNRHHTIMVDNFRGMMEYYDIQACKSGNKFIPDDYKYNSRSVRIDVLKGLMDTDGSVGYGGNPIFSTTSKRLRDDIIEIARSLGINCNIKDCVKNEHSYSWTVIFYTDTPLFNLPRKYNKQKITKNRAFKTGIYDIKYIGKEQCKCITVDSKDNCYLIGDFIKTHNCEGAIEIFEMPHFVNGEAQRNRYIGGQDGYDDDASNTVSLGSIFILDLFTDRIVAEYTGRPKFANDFFEICRRMLLFYNAVGNYENDKKGLFGYFDRKNSLHLLSDTLQSLRDIEMVRGNLYGNKNKGTNSGKFINARARRLLADYMMTDAQGESGDNRKLNLHKIRSIGLLLEALKWNVNGNFDRISACGMLMLLREDRQKYLENAMKSESERRTGMQYDSYFIKNSHGLLSYNNEKFQIDN